ncbi:MAG: PilZ domain-containing protein [Firmicutes bacterium]|nr:PilZ domain-containing protein [Bacillota bacterium]
MDNSTGGGPREFHMRVLGKSAGAKVDLYFTDSEFAHRVSGNLTVRGNLFGVTIPPGTPCPHHGCFRAQVYTMSGVRALGGFAVRISPEEIRMFPSGLVEHRERRRSVRVPFQANVTYRLLRYLEHDLTESKGVGTGICLDLGLSGLGISTPIELPEHLTIGVTVNSPGWDAFGEVECVVNRVQQTLSGWLTGLGFENPSTAFTAYVKRFVLDSLHTERKTE